MKLNKSSSISIVFFPLLDWRNSKSLGFLFNSISQVDRLTRRQLSADWHDEDVEPVEVHKVEHGYESKQEIGVWHELLLFFYF